MLDLQTVCNALVDMYYAELNIILGRKLTRPTVIISNRMTRCWGMATVKSGEYIIKISGKVYVGNEATMALRNTVAHEVAHLVEYELYGEFSHSDRWAYFMTLLGQTPNRTVTDEKKAETGYIRVRRQNKKYSHACRCKNHHVGGRVHKNIISGSKYKCRSCGTYLDSNYVVV